MGRPVLARRASAMRRRPPPAQCRGADRPAPARDRGMAMTAATHSPAVRPARARLCVPQAGGWAAPRGLTSRVALPLMPAAALPRVLTAAGLDWRLQPADPADLAPGPGAYCW